MGQSATADVTVAYVISHLLAINPASVYDSTSQWKVRISPARLHNISRYTGFSSCLGSPDQILQLDATSFISLILSG